ncbi:hypothetical protein JCM1840_006930 [Sporobolomyces johnsonii]
MPLRGFPDARRTRPQSSLHHSPQARLVLARGAMSSGPTTTAALTAPAPLSCLSGNAAVFRPRHPHVARALQYQQRRAAGAPGARKGEEGFGRREGEEGAPERLVTAVVAESGNEEGKDALGEEEELATPTSVEASVVVDLPIRSDSLSDFEIIHRVGGNVVVSLDQDDSALSSTVAPTCAPSSEEDDDDWELLAYDEEERDNVDIKAVPPLNSTTTNRGDVAVAAAAA